MNMKKYIYILPLLLMGFSACDSVLDTTDLMNKTNENFPSKPADIESMCAAVYQPMAQEQFGEFFISTIASDEAFGGGGPDDIMTAAMDNLNKNQDNMLASTWTNYYSGIYRANRLIENIDKVKFIFNKDKNQLKGEAYFMRAWYHFSLARIFGEVPVMTTSEKVILPKAPVAKLYGQIASDLKYAIDSLFDKDYTRDIQKTSFLGHANIGAAQALLARVYLFYTGYYQTDVLPLANGQSLSKQEVITYLEQVVFGGYELAKDYRTLWPYTNSFTVKDYLYTKGQNLLWKGEDGLNLETVFAIKFGNLGAFGNSAMNAVNTAFGLRNQDELNKNTFPFGPGWGQGTVNTRLVDKWKTEEPTDPRIKMSILDVDDKAEGIVKYNDGGWSQMHDTHHFIKKYTPIMAKVGSKLYPSYTMPMYGASEKPYERESQDIVLIRFSDVWLMLSELNESTEGINMVRQRVGLPIVNAYSFEALEKERRHELAFEGVRYFDLLRWYRKDAGKILFDNQNGVSVLNSKVKSAMSFDFVSRFNKTGGFWPIPAREISLSKGILVQNPGWE
jgi:starch-binding outer membrane protein, SusD/RagB family